MKTLFTVHDITFKLLFEVTDCDCGVKMQKCKNSGYNVACQIISKLSKWAENYFLYIFEVADDDYKCKIMKIMHVKI